MFLLTGNYVEVAKLGEGSMKREFRNICFLLIFSTLMAISASGQNVTSTLVGQVNDPSGGGVPNAHVTVTNTATGISSSGITSSTGAYSVSGLQPGTYAVSVGAAGFSTFNENGIVVQSTQTVRVDIALKVGAVSQTVNVTGAAPLIATDSASIGSTLNMQQVRTLPSSIQSVAPLLVMVPGATVGMSLSNPQFAGASHWGASNFTLNGVSLDDIGNGGGSYAYASGDANTNLINLPPIDTLQEFHVVDINENAEFSDLATVAMVTKQGTNQFHGDVYEFFKNAVLNANSYQLNATGQPRPQNNLNQFGGTIGGPIWKNKVFFFFAPVYYRSIASGLAQLTWPSKAMQGGDFSALLAQGTQLYNPQTGQPFPNNQIPTSMFAPQSVALLKYLPAPTVADSPGIPNGPHNFFESVPVRTSMNSYTVRGDYQIGPSDSILGIYTSSNTPEWNVFQGYSPSFGNTSNFGFTDHSINLGETHTFNSTTMNEFRAAWYKHVSVRFGVNGDFDPSKLFPQLTPGLNRGLPTMGVSGYNNVAYDYGDSGIRGGTYTLEFNDNFTKVVNNHTIKVGFEERGYKSIAPGGTGSHGSFSFSGVWTGNKGWPGQPHSQGNSFADFLLGDANSATRSTVSTNKDVYNRIIEGYGQDTWQVNPRLTLNYGVRYMYQTVVNVSNNARSFYDQKNNKIALAQNSATPTPPVDGNQAFFQAYLPYFETTQSIGLSTHYMRPSKNYWQPRIGFAFRPFANTVIRGGYGVYYNFNILDFGMWDSLNLPFGSNSETASSKLPGKPVNPYQPDITFANPFGSATVNLALNPTIYSVQPDIKNARIQQYSLTVERQFWQNWMGRASYVGSLGRDLPYFEEDINQPLVQIPNTPYQQQRPEQPWSTISAIRSDGGAKLNFNQLQLEAIRRYDNGVSFQAEYSWTRSLDNVNNVGGPQQIAYPDLDYGNSTGIHTHTLVFHYLYALPFGHDRRWLNHSSQLVNALAGGWQVSGITTYATGTPFSVSFSVPSNYIGWAGGRADRIKGVPVYLSHSGHDVIKGVPYFNPAAFGPPQPWTWGNSGRNILWGPGLWNWDMSALKDVSVFRDRVKTTLRADFFDAFNHFNLGGPSAQVASPQYGGLPVPNAGKILGGSGNRTIQLGLRVAF
ncbi:MAG TPA: carboxypeptidase-like regulatory domain-containing protein [Edaphobacter sp.]|nr:carboxypeptidase-like regulatory domain-containing protein [Edaphobacter sp.]